MVRRTVAGSTFVLGVAVAVLLLSAGTAAPAETTADQPPLTTPEGFADAEFEIRVHRNGSARWVVRASRPLDNQSEIDRFRAFAREFETSESSAFRNFRLRADRLVAFGTNATGREMNATDFERNARVVELGQTRGVVELSFLWTNFSRTDGQRVIVDDVFQGGMFIDSGQRLVIARGDGVVFESVDPPPDSQSVEDNLTASETVTWLGKRDFTDRRPRAVFVPPDLAGEGEGTPSSPDTDTGPGTATPASDGKEGEDEPGGVGLLPLVVAAVVLLVLGGGFALYSGAAGDIRSSAGKGGAGAGSNAGTAGPGSAAGAEPSSRGATVPDEELVSDEDRVLQLLEDNGGRMKQVEIVDETEWSKSKVSMLLSDMAEEGTISKLRVGRENIISKSGHEPEAAGSPFEEE